MCLTALPIKTMKCSCFLLAAVGLMIAAASALSQVVPATPKKFTKRIAGAGSVSTGTSSLPQRPAPEIKQVTYITLSEARQFNSTDGKSLIGKLIAFEDFTVVTTNGAQPQTPPVPPTNPTVVKDGKARLLVNSKPFEVPLDRLSEADRDFVDAIRLAVAAKSAKAAPGKP